MDYHEKIGFLENQADKYGINLDEYSVFGDETGIRGTSTKSYGALEEAVSKASQNDYSNRRALEAAGMAGNKKAQKIMDMNEGIDQLAATEHWMEKMHGKHVGGGDYTWGSDAAGVAQHYVDRDREKFTNQIQGMMPEETGVDENAKTEELKDVVLSDHMQKAKDRIDQFEGAPAPAPVYGSDEGQMAQKTGQKSIFADSAKKVYGINEQIDINNVNNPDTEADAFLETKKNQVKNDFNFKPAF
jgi:hypothetical protein